MPNRTPPRGLLGLLPKMRVTANTAQTNMTCHICRRVVDPRDKARFARDVAAMITDDDAAAQSESDDENE